MGGERSSTTRMRLVGKICSFYRRQLAAPYPGRERACAECKPETITREVYMRFERCHGWRVSFYEPGSPTTRFREFTFADASKLAELLARSATRMLLEDRQAFELGLRNGTGAVKMTLTAQQFHALLDRR